MGRRSAGHWPGAGPTAVSRRGSPWRFREHLRRGPPPQSSLLRSEYNKWMLSPIATRSDGCRACSISTASTRLLITRLTPPRIRTEGSGSLVGQYHAVPGGLCGDQGRVSVEFVRNRLWNRAAARDTGYPRFVHAAEPVYVRFTDLFFLNFSHAGSAFSGAWCLQDLVPYWCLAGASLVPHCTMVPRWCLAGASLVPRRCLTGASLVPPQFVVALSFIWPPRAC